MIAMKFRVADHGQAFSTRPRGVAMLEQLVAEATDVPVAEIDFDQVTSISYSFADEFIGALMERAVEGQYSFEPQLVNVPPALQRILIRSLDNRGVKNARDLVTPKTETV